MVEVPDIFLATADWVCARPLGCPAAANLTGVLVELTGPARFAVTCPGAQLSGSGRRSAAHGLQSAGPACEAPPRPRRIPWPAACGVAADVVIIERSGAPGAAARGRIVDGPQLFVTSHSPTETQRLLSTPIDPDALLAVRTRLLAAELRATAYRVAASPSVHQPGAGERGGVAAQLRAIAELSQVGARGFPGDDPLGRDRAAPTVAVMGPEKRACRGVAQRLEHAGATLVPPAAYPAPAADWRRAGAATSASSARPDAVVAVAPKGGWREVDLDNFWQISMLAAGSLILSTAPLPSPGLVDAVVSEAELAQWLIGGQLPEIPRPGWRRAAELVRRRRQSFAAACLRGVEQLPDPCAGHARIERLAAELRIPIPAREPARLGAFLRECLPVLAVVVLGAGLTAARSVGPLRAVAAGLIAGAAVAATRWAGYRRGVARRQLRARVEAITHAVAPGAGVAAPHGGIRWLNLRAAGVIGGAGGTDGAAGADRGPAGGWRP